MRPEHITIIGLLAGALTTLSFLPQVIKTWKTKSADDLSLGMLILFALGVFLWLIYGIHIREMPVIIANTATLILITIIIYFKVKYSHKKQRRDL